MEAAGQFASTPRSCVSRAHGRYARFAGGSKDGVVDRLDTVAHGIEPPGREVGSSRTFGQSGAIGSVFKKIGDRYGGAAHVACGRDDTVDAVPEDFLQPGQLRGDAGATAGKILHDHARQSFPHRRQDAYVRQIDQPLGFAVISDQVNIGLNRGTRDRRLHGGPGRPFSGQEQLHVGDALDHRRERLDEFDMALPWLQCRQHQHHRRLGLVGSGAEQPVRLARPTRLSEALELEA